MVSGHNCFTKSFFAMTENKSRCWNMSILVLFVSIFRSHSETGMNYIQKAYLKVWFCPTVTFETCSRTWPMFYLHHLLTSEMMRIKNRSEIVEFEIRFYSIEKSELNFRWYSCLSINTILNICIKCMIGFEFDIDSIWITNQRLQNRF